MARSAFDRQMRALIRALPFLSRCSPTSTPPLPGTSIIIRAHHHFYKLIERCLLPPPERVLSFARIPDQKIDLGRAKKLRINRDNDFARIPIYGDLGLILSRPFQIEIEAC